MTNRAPVRYLDELISFGGIAHTRAEVIAILSREGHDPRCIDRWLQGADYVKEREQRRLRSSTLSA
jgi:hypothetical protein